LSERNLEARWRPLVALLFAFAFLFSLWALSVAFGNDIMDEHSFRQTQTAYATYWMMKGGPFFAYETPFFGFPWSAPFELPIYQWIVAKLAAFSGLGIEASGRIVGRGFFYLALWPLYSIFRSLKFSSTVSLAGLSIYLLSPLYLYWSRTFMIESTALFFSLAYSALFIRALQAPTLALWLLCAAAGALAGAAKITTAFAFYLLNTIFWAVEWRAELFRPGRWKSRSSWELLGFGFLLPGLLSLVWVHYSDALKMENSLAALTSSAALKDWNFGTWAQRVAGSTWYMFFRKTLRDAIGHRAAWIISVLLLPAIAKRERLLYLAASLLFLAPPMVFTNLHIAHNYYWYANGIFMIAALTCTLAGLWRQVERHWVFSWLFAAFLLLVCGYEVHTFIGFPYHWQQETNPGPRLLGQRVQELSKPDDVIWVSGAGWYPAVVFYTQRRSIMDPMSYGPANPLVRDAVVRTVKAGYHVALFMVCLENKGKHSFVEEASKVAELETQNLGDPLCDIYRVRGLKN
jgi:Dolichyl-phosphate-mannose-protein mannosyltransferase